MSLSTDRMHAYDLVSRFYTSTVDGHANQIFKAISRLLHL